MSDLNTALDTFASDEDWTMMAEHAGIPAPELKAKVMGAIANLTGDASNGLTSQEGAPISDLALTTAQTNDDCISQDFSVSLFEIVGIKGTLKVCGKNASNWSAKLEVCLTVAGASVWCTSYAFGTHNLSVCFSPSVGIAKANLCFDIERHSNKICLNISGNACYWRFGYKCANFDETIFCIPT